VRSGLHILGRCSSGVERLLVPVSLTLAAMSVRAAIVAGGVIGLIVGIAISVTTDIPLAPEAGLALGAMIGWRSQREST
jgi:hypothetical protein